ncbi:DNA-binding transcriptional MerR regulator [Saccharothrix saharensis]|uniref:DNA-binding transcriptional MerR regulator n=1 Tax=Saccharothrix saharensis TaxID=571190 RepID=A0A543JNR9_9PSEU|nr:MerR family transcriptional regulator [Saccharothrix saharensis]TQM84497.1 DNA-binding transcriptional MerR regulator [Saccharothrix saharensis]
MSKIRITRLAEITGFTPATIRFYENTGLLPAASRTSSGHRVYDDSDVDRLRFIARGKHMGLALDEIRELVHSCGDDLGTADLGRVLGTLRTRITEVNERVAELSTFSAQLVSTLWAVRSQHVPGSVSVEPTCREHWARVLSHPHTRRHGDDSITFTFPGGPALVPVLTDLVAHEVGCGAPAVILLRCTGHTTVLEVAAAEATRRLIADLSGESTSVE